MTTAAPINLQSEDGWTNDARSVMQLSADAISLATATVDMRAGLDGLSLHLQQALGQSPCDGNVAAASRPVHFAVRTDSKKSHPHIPLVTERQYRYWNSPFCKYA